jgi:hypothetical protein
MRCAMRSFETSRAASARPPISLVSLESTETESFGPRNARDDVVPCGRSSSASAVPWLTCDALTGDDFFA